MISEIKEIKWHLTFTKVDFTFHTDELPRNHGQTGALQLLGMYSGGSRILAGWLCKCMGGVQGEIFYRDHIFFLMMQWNEDL